MVQWKVAHCKGIVFKWPLYQWTPVPGYLWIYTTLKFNVQPENGPRKRRSLLKAIIFRFYVKLRGRIYIYTEMNIYIYVNEYIYILYSWWYPFTSGETGPLLADFWISFWWRWCDHISFKRHRPQRLDHDLYHQIQKGQLLFLFSLWRKQIQAFAWFRLSIPGDF